MNGYWCLALAGGLGTTSAALGQVTLVSKADTVGLTSWHAPGTCIQLGRAQMSTGLAVGDFNLDGYPDLLCMTTGDGPDRLFINDGDGTFTDEAAEWGIDEDHCGTSATVADFDGDGYPDIFVISHGIGGEFPSAGKCRLYRNNAGTSFTDVAATAGLAYTSPTVAEGWGSAWGDYDLDGDLDLMVSTHTTQFGDPVQSDGNRVFRNNGDGTFNDVTGFALGEACEGVRGFQPSFFDIDGDCYPEILFAADFETSRYLINNRDGTFSEYTQESGTGLDANGMGQAIADLDNDGYWDWYVTSVHLEGPWGGVNTAVPGTGNMLYMGQGNHTYDETSLTAGVNDGGWGWGTVAVDLDHDGWQELLEVNGWPQGLFWIGERGKLFYNNTDGTFTEMAVAGGFDAVYQGRGLVYFDAELDGDLDIAVSNYLGPIEYFENQTNSGNWLRITLDTSDNSLLPSDGYGTRITATAGGMSQMRYVNGSPSYLSTSELAAHFGFGSATQVDELRFEWSRGQVTVLTDVATNQHLSVEGPRLGDIDLDGIIGIGDFLALIGYWGPVDDKSKMPADIDADGVIGITDFLFILGNWD